jgi:hypothetical protein
MNIPKYASRADLEAHNARVYHMTGAHVFELSYVSISKEKFVKHYDDNLLIELYGYIILTDDDNGDKFHLFFRAETEAATVNLSDDELDILRGSRYSHPPLLSKSFTIEMCLQDKKRGILVKESFYLNFGGEVMYEKQRVHVCEYKESGYASVSYTVIPYAVLGCVYISVDNAHEKDPICKGKDLTGSIYASYKLGNTRVRRILCDDFSVKDSSTLPLEHELPWLAVPSYALSLEVEVDLRIDGCRVDDLSVPLLFPVDDNSSFSGETVVVRDRWRVQVSVDWRHPFRFLDRDSCPERTNKSPDIFDYDSNDISSCSASQQLLHHRRISASNSQTLLIQFVEVFSISVYTHGYDGQLRLRGTVEACDPFYRNMIMFTSGKNEAVTVESGGNLHLIQADRCYWGANFEISLDLEDIDRREKIKGVVFWDGHTSLDWNNRRICSVIAGKEGYAYAAVHYSFFDEAIRAIVKIVVYSKVVNHVGAVTGRVCTRYTKHRYFSRYERKFESVLFENGRPYRSDSPITLDGYAIPLSKAAVAVPLDLSLIVKVNLRVSGDWCANNDHISGYLQFQPKKPTKNMHRHKSEHQQLEGKRKNCSIDVSVEWG